MVTRAVKNSDDLTLLTRYLKERKRPFTVDITDGRDRSAEQNRLAFKWYKEVSEQTGEDVEDVRARCKLEIGVPILREDDDFRRTYDRLIRPLAYSDKIDLIKATDMPVTRLMKVEQMTRFMDAVFRSHAEHGIVLTIPPDRYAYNPANHQSGPDAPSAPGDGSGNGAGPVEKPSSGDPQPSSPPPDDGAPIMER